MALSAANGLVLSRVAGEVAQKAQALRLGTAPLETLDELCEGLPATLQRLVECARDVLGRQVDDAQSELRRVLPPHGILDALVAVCGGGGAAAGVGGRALCMLLPECGGVEPAAGFGAFFALAGGSGALARTLYEQWPRAFVAACADADDVTQEQLARAALDWRLSPELLGRGAPKGWMAEGSTDAGDAGGAETNADYERYLRHRATERALAAGRQVRDAARNEANAQSLALTVKRQFAELDALRADVSRLRDEEHGRARAFRKWESESLRSGRADDNERARLQERCVFRLALFRCSCCC